MSINRQTKRLRSRTLGGVLAFVAITFSIHQPTVIAAESDGAPKDILIVANKGVENNAVSIALIRDLFLKVRKAWNDGERVLPINPKDKVLRDDFRSKVLSMNKTSEQRYWEEQKVKYGESAPPEISNNLKAVFKLKGSVSYVYRKDYLDNVSKVLLVIPAGNN